MTFPSIPIDHHVPTAIRADVYRVLADLRAGGGSAFLINVPAEDFARTMEAVTQHVHYPFTPTLCGEAIAPWERAEIGVFARADMKQTTPILFTADGREHQIT